MSEIIIPKNTNEAKSMYRLARQGKLRRIHKGMYTDDLETPLEKLIQTKWLNIIPHIVSKGILSNKTAYVLKPIPFQNNNSIVFITSTYNKTITLPGLIIKVLKGNTDDFTEQLTVDLAKSNEARMLLENLKIVRGKAYHGVKSSGKHEIEQYLAKKLRFGNEEDLLHIRTSAQKVARSLNMNREFNLLTNIIGALLATQSAGDMLSSAYAKAIAQKEPFDANRLDRFQSLALYLSQCNFINRQYVFSTTRFKNLSFFESYFSNYIEGTKFIIDEAEDIVFSGHEINNRHADSHDILTNYTLSNNFLEMNETPEDVEQFIELLQRRHAILMQERPEKNPGVFKKKPNKAGNTYFVAPEEVLGTLTHAFKIYQYVQNGLAKALFMQFLISEIHPFDDGNGRLARMMMNAELVKENVFKIIVPTVCRDNYLNGLRMATKNNNFYIYCKVMDQLQAYTSSLNWQDYDEARNKIEKDCADHTPDEGLPIFYRAIRQLRCSGFTDMEY